jgi:predicted aspartyl protease
MPKSEIERLELSVLADTDAILADGSTARLRCYYCVVDWMGQTVPVQVVENIANPPLIGTALLKMTKYLGTVPGVVRETNAMNWAADGGIER